MMQMWRRGEVGLMRGVHEDQCNLDQRFVKTSAPREFISDSRCMPRMYWHALGCQGCAAAKAWRMELGGGSRRLL